MGVLLGSQGGPYARALPCTLRTPRHPSPGYTHPAPRSVRVLHSTPPHPRRAAKRAHRTKREKEGGSPGTIGTARCGPYNTVLQPLVESAQSVPESVNSREYQKIGYAKAGTGTCLWAPVRARRPQVLASKGRSVQATPSNLRHAPINGASY